MKKRNEKEERGARAALAAHQATPEQLLLHMLAQQQLQPAYLPIMWLYRALRESSPWGYIVYSLFLNIDQCGLLQPTFLLAWLSFNVIMESLGVEA